MHTLLRFHFLTLIVSMVALTGALPATADPCVTTPDVLRSENFSGTPGGTTFAGNAYVGGGILHLTDAVNSQNGTWGFATGQVMEGFLARMDLLIGGGTDPGADGFSFSYSNWGGGAVGDFGEGSGLIVRLVTWTSNFLEVRYGGANVATIPLSQGLIRLNTFVPLDISVLPNGFCSVAYNRNVLFAGTLPGWNPQSGWSVFVGARTGGANDNHHVDNFELRELRSPCVDSLTRADATPVLAGTSSVSYDLLLSTTALNLDSSDFTLTPLSGAPSATIQSVSGSTLNFFSNLDSAPPNSALAGNAVYTGGVLQLTDAVNGQSGTFVWSPGEALPGFRAEFDLRIGGGSSADGFGFHYGPHSLGSLVNFEGSGSGLTVTFDTYPNAGDDPPDVTVKFNGVDLSRSRHEVRTGSSFAPTVVEVTTGGLCTVMHNNAVLMADVALPGWNPPASWNLALSANTGGANDNHSVNDLWVRNSRHTITLNNLGGEGELRLDVQNASINDVDGGALDPNSYAGDEAYTFDLVPPQATSIVFGAGTTSPTNATSVSFDVTFSENVTGFDNNDIAVTPTGTANYATIGVTGSGQNYTVTLNSVTGNGSLSIAVITGSGVQDVLGNSLQSSVSSPAVTIDNLAPTAVCQNVTVNLSGDTTVTAAEVNDGSSDANGLASVVLQGGDQTYGCADIATNPNQVTLVVTDNAGNQSTCTADVTVVDDVNPVAVCQNVTVDVTSGGTITAADVNNGSSDNCGITSLALQGGDIPVNCANVGTQQVTLVVEDAAGNQDTCTANVTINDTTSPTAVCQNVTANLSAGGTVTAADVDNGSSDNCTVASLTLQGGDVAVTCANLGTQTVTLVVEDGAGNQDTCTADVTIVDDVDPVAVCQNVTVNLSAGGTVTAADVDSGSSDNCGIAGISLQGGDIAVNCANVGTQQVTLVVTDDAGNQGTCTANVTIIDDIAPVAACQNVTVNVSSGGTITAADIDNGSNDNCGIDSLTLQGGDIAVNCANVGTQQVTLVVEDAAGNQVTCTANVTINDDVSPVANCQNITVNLSAGGFVTGADVNDASSDNCGIDSLTLQGGNIAVNCANVGTQQVTLLVEDAAGNQDTCTADVTIVDDVNPVAVCQDVTVNLSAGGTITAADVDNGSSDNCGVASVALQGGDIAVDCANVGTQTVTLVVEDVAGNQGTCDAMVTIVDDIGPTAVCTDITLPLDAGGQASLAPADIDGGSSDNCGITQRSIDITEFGCSAAGMTVPVTLTVEDASGNQDSCLAQVTITDPQGACTGPGLTVSAESEPNVTQPEGSAAMFMVSVANASGAVTYQWKFQAPETKAFVPLTDGGNISGATTAVLTIDPVAPSDQGEYLCEVSDLFETAVSDTFTLTLGAGVPVGGALGMGLLAALSALTGVAAIRRRK